MASADKEFPLSLKTLFDSCSEITSISLSCRTLGYNDRAYSDTFYDVEGKNEVISSNAHYNAANSMEYQNAIQNEIEIGKWLDGHINEYKSALHRQKNALKQSNGKRINENTKLTLKERKRKKALQNAAEEEEIQQLKQDLFDETVHRQQEISLIHRIQMSAASKCVAFPMSDFAATTETINSLSKERYLTKESLRIRDAKVLETIQSKRESDLLQGRLHEVTQKCRAIKEKNWKLWKVYQRLHNSPSGDHTNKPDVPSEDLCRLKKENELLKQCYLNIITGADIDWYSDHRLCKIMYELEKT